MPDRRTHRGAHPEDAESFHPRAHPALRAAVADLSWLLTRHYAQPSALKIVGDRYNLTARQRTAVMRCACSDYALASRLSRRIDEGALRDRTLLIDGYNVLTTIEAALSGGVLLHARDSTFRDMASIHGSYRKVEETTPALELAGQVLAELKPARCIWYLDQPVSNSGRLKTIMMNAAEKRLWKWRVEIVANPDALLIESADPIASADSVILDGCQRWFNLARRIVTAKAPSANVVDLSDAATGG